MEDKPEKSMEEIIRRDGRYPAEAFAFLHEGLTGAVKHVYGSTAENAPAQRHVTGRQLCLALKDLALKRWGMLAKAVLEKWNIRSTMDFGNMVYLLIQNRYMRKTEQDSVEDFRDVFNFDTAFGGDQEFELKE